VITGILSTCRNREGDNSATHCAVVCPPQAFRFSIAPLMSYSNEKIFFQSFFMLITAQPFFFVSS
jgi:hypothetical protein